MRSLSHVPHSGWGNQIVQLENAIYLAQSLRRHLVVPPLLEHFDIKRVDTQHKFYTNCANISRFTSARYSTGLLRRLTPHRPKVSVSHSERTSRMLNQRLAC